MRKYSRIFWTLNLFGIVSLAWTINAWELRLASICAIGMVCTFIFFWTAQMLPNNEKYRNE